MAGGKWQGASDLVKVLHDIKLSTLADEIEAGNVFNELILLYYWQSLCSHKYAITVDVLFCFIFKLVYMHMQACNSYCH